MFTPYNLAKFEYTKVTDGSKTTRVVIPVTVPSPDARMFGVDVTHLPESAQAEMLELMKGYGEYHHDAMKRIFSFEDWVSHTTGLSEDAIPDVQWRSFYLSNIAGTGEDS